jgi:hypothetical protein
MKAILIYHKTEIRPDGIKLEMVIWQLPAATPDRPHGLKYRFGQAGMARRLYATTTNPGKAITSMLVASRSLMPGRT